MIFISIVFEMPDLLLKDNAAIFFKITYQVLHYVTLFLTKSMCLYCIFFCLVILVCNFLVFSSNLQSRFSAVNDRGAEH